MCAPNLYGDDCKKTCECNEQNTEMYVLHDIIILHVIVLFFICFKKGVIHGVGSVHVSQVGLRIIVIVRVPF